MLRALVLMFAVGLAANGAVIYSNTATGLGFQDVFSDAGVTEIGDQVTLGAGPRQLQSVTASLISYTDAVTEDVILRIYEVGPGNTVGALLGSSTLSSVTFPADSRTVLTFTGWNLTLPDELIWTLGFGGGVSPVLGVEVYSPPTVGTSDPAFVWWRSGGVFSQQSFPDIDNNYFLEIDAADVVNTVPEPGTVGMILTACVLGLTWHKGARR